MAKNTGAVITRIETVLGLVAEGTYTINTAGELYKGAKLIKGSVGSEDGQRWYNIKGMSIQGQRLMYAYYHGGASVLNDNMVVKHLDGDTLNNAIDNLVQVNKIGWKAELEEKRAGLNLEAVSMEDAEVVVPAVVTETPAVSLEEEAVATLNGLTAKEQEAVAIWNMLLEGKSIKEVAEALNVRTSRVYDVKRGKSNSSVTSKLQPLA